MKTKTFFFVCSCVILFFSSHSYPETIKIAGSAWCPLNCYPDENKPGVMVEIAQSVLAKSGYDIEYSEVPWGRSINDTRVGQYDACIGPTKADAPELIFPSEEIAISQMCFYVLNNNDWTFDGVGTLRDVDLCVLKDDSFNAEIDAYIGRNADTKLIQFVYASNYLERTFRMVEIGRCTATVSDRNVVEFFLKKHGKEGVFKNAGCTESLGNYLAFSPEYEKSELVSEIISKGIKELRRSGGLKGILDKYGINDWK